MAFSINVNAYDFAVKNADGQSIYYNYINNGTEVGIGNDSIKVQL